MRKNIVKNMLILMLSLLSLYLTGQLWFERISNRNFFYTLLSTLVYSAPESAEVREMIAPHRIITNFGNRAYDIRYSRLAESVQSGDCDEALALALRSGELAQKALSWDELLEKRSYICEYKTAIPTDITPIKSSLKGGSLISKTGSINMIAVIPGESGDKLRVSFVDTEGRAVYEYSVKADDLNARMLRNISELESGGTALYYVSSKQKEMGAFDENIFVPQWDAAAYSYSPVNISNPYMYQGDLLISKIEKAVSIFFSNPAAINPDKSNEDFIFTSGTTVVKYNRNDTLEYSDYSTAEAVGGSSFTSDYHAALAFIAMDTAVENEYRLARYEEEDGRTTFYFDFFLNNFPLIIPESMNSDIDMRHPIEITVRNRKVVKYRKLVYVFKSVGLGTETANFRFADALEQIRLMSGRPSGQDEQIKLDNVELGYKVEVSNYMRLGWFIGIKGQTLAFSSRM